MKSTIQPLSARELVALPLTEMKLRMDAQEDDYIKTVLVPKVILLLRKVGYHADKVELDEQRKSHLVWFAYGYCGECGGSGQVVTKDKPAKCRDCHGDGYDVSSTITTSFEGLILTIDGEAV